MKERNEAYYTKFPEDIERVKGILSYLRRENVVGSTGKSILPERFQQLGIMFGMKGIFTLYFSPLSPRTK